MATIRKQSKYKNKRVTVDGINFQSKREAARYQDLVLYQRAGDIRELRCQVPFTLSINGVKVATYIADFTYFQIHEPFNKFVVEDCKGVRTPVYRLKAKMFKAQYGITILET